MSVTAADVAELRRVAAELPDNDDLRDLQTAEEILAYVVAVARAEGLDEADAVELVASGAAMSRHDLRQAASIMGKVGYTAVAARLRVLARKAKPEPMPNTFAQRWAHKRTA
jgi:hypothetical protein